MNNSVIFTQICPNVNYTQNEQKNKTHTWNKHLLNTRNKNLQVKSTIL